jgi:hypothetical protein
MTYIDHGTTGAYRATWRKGNPRSVLETIVAKNPKATPKQIWDVFHRETEDDSELIVAMKWYWFDNNLKSILRDEDSPPPTQASKSEKESAIKKIKDRIKYEASQLLELIMPNDKRLADCTGAECRAFGGWLIYVAKKVPGNRTVGEILTEKQLYRMFRAAIKK